MKNKNEIEILIGIVEQYRGGKFLWQNTHDSSRTSYII